YLERAVEAGGLVNVEVVHARAEEWADGFGACDLVTARALAALPVVCEYAAPLLAAGGVLVAWKGEASADEAQAGAAAAADLAPVSQDRAHAGAVSASSGHGLEAAAGRALTPGRGWAPVSC